MRDYHRRLAPGFALLLLSAAAHAQAEAVAAAVGAGILIALGVVFTAGLVLFAAFGGKRAAKRYVAVWGVLFLGFVAWMQVNDHLNRRHALVAFRTEAKRCLSDAGESGRQPQFQPERVFVLLDPKLSDSGISRLGRKDSPPENVVYVSDFPSPRPSRSAFVQIVHVLEPIPDAPDWWFNGYRALLSDSDQKVFASRFDFKRRGWFWCLGGQPSVDIDRFVEHYLGTAIGLRFTARAVGWSAPTYSPLGVLSSFRSYPRESAEESQTTQAVGLPQIPLKSLCARAPHVRPEDRSRRCAPNTDAATGFDLNDSMHARSLPDGWLLLRTQSYDPESLDSLDVDRYDADDRLVARWHVRFPAIPTPPRRFSRIGAVRLDRGDLHVDLLFQSPMSEAATLTFAINTNH